MRNIYKWLLHTENQSQKLKNEKFWLKEVFKINKSVRKNSPKIKRKMSVL
jgi:hypothetical protein